MHVRQAHDDDLTAMAALRKAWTEEYAGQSIDDDAYLDNYRSWHAMERERRITWLAELADEPIGMLNMVVFTRMPRPRPEGGPEPIGRWGYIANMFVRPEHRNNGIGSALVQAAIEYADEHRYARIVLTPSEKAVPFYGRAGFVPATMLMVRPGRN